MSSTLDIKARQDQQNALIAERVVEFLRKRIQIYQKLIPKYLKDEETYGQVRSSIKYADFMDRYNRLKNDALRYKNSDYEAEAISKLADFESTFSRYVELSEEEIDGLLNAIKESITKYGFGDRTFVVNEAKLIERVMTTLNNSLLSCSISNKNLNYYKYAKIMGKMRAGFIEKICGSFSWDLNYNFKISIENAEAVCYIDESSNDFRQGKIAKEDIYLADDLKVVKCKTRDGKNLCLSIFLNTIVDGKPKAKQIRNSGYYDLNSSQLREVALNDSNAEWYQINDFLKTYGLGEFIDHIYNFNDLLQIVHEFDALQEYSEDQKKGINEAVDAAVTWLDSNFVRSCGPREINATSLRKFATLLTKLIRIRISRNQYYYLETRRYNGNPLYEIAKEAGLDLDFGNQDIVMWITHSEVSAGSATTKQKISIYKFGENPNQGQSSGICPTLTPPEIND